MCNNCNCDAYSICSIVGHLPIGFCCSKCNLYDEKRICLKTQTKRKADVSVAMEELEKDLEPISTCIENGLIKVIVEKKGKEVPIYIDLKKQLSSE